MSSSHDIDHDDSFSHFDPYEFLTSSPSPAQDSAMQYANISDLSDPSSSHGHETLDDHEISLSSSASKGKGVTRPLPIRPKPPAANDAQGGSSPSSSGVVSVGHNTSSPSSRISTSPFSYASPDTYDQPESIAYNLFPQFWEPQLGYHSLEIGKGKERDMSCFLPSPIFNLTGLDHEDHEHSVWSPPSSPTAGPSNQCSPTCPNVPLRPSTASHDSTVPASPESSTSASTSPRAQGDIFTLKRMPSRRRSLSNLSLRCTEHFDSLSMSRVKAKLNISRLQSNIARTLLFRKRNPAKEQGETTRAPGADVTDPIVSVLGSDVSYYPDDPLSSVQPSDLPFSSSELPLLRTKARSKSLPVTISALDYVPVSSLDIYEPIPLIIKNYFDDELPKEIHLNILRSLVELHELDFQRFVASGRWSVAKATSPKCQWVGKAKGMRELFKLSRVSKSWQRLVFDGQLWHDLDLHSFPGLPEQTLLRLSQIGRSFIQSLNLAGHVQFHPSILFNVTDNLCLTRRFPNSTQLTTVNLQGCTLLTTRSLHHLLIQSESLQTLNVKGLCAVTNTTCDILANYCPLITHLNMSRCANMDAEGIKRLAAAAVDRGAHLHLKTLRVSGLKNIDDKTMSILGKATPHLEVLDLSYSRQLHNSAIEAFVSCKAKEKPDTLGVDVVSLSARAVGRESGDRDQYSRRITRLRHISLSYCVLLTDVACSNLAYSVPRLELLEMAGIGSDLKDDGLVRLLRTTPHIRRVDLEDATDLTDAVLSAITPDPVSGGERADRGVKVGVQPGYALEHLVISYANQVSDGALLSLIRNCPRLRCLEADNTRMGATVLREFVKQNRERRVCNAKIVAVDCRGIADGLMKELTESIRPRMGWRLHAARKLTYLDARDENADELKVGQDECDERRVVVKSFYSWQTVDAVRSAREKRRRSTRRIIGDGSDYEDGSWRTRWWSPGGQRLSASGRNTPQSLADMNNNDGCRVM
ncbi:hypothetical protein AX17_000468 [Amanita inopinata Kibby_2008]|nr:hypothetical protein AX17_000468 [Amanita inopinata Kibby_2008]